MRISFVASADKFSGVLTKQTGSASKTNAPSFRRGIFLTLVAVGLFALSVPGRSLPWLAWVAMVPLFYALRTTTPLRGVFLSGLFGWLMWFTSVWWLHAPLRDIAGMSSFAGIFFTMAGCLAMGLPYAIAGGIISWSRGKSGLLKSVCDASILTLAVIWLTPIFPGHAAHTQYLYPIVLQVLEIGGAPLLLFLMLLVNALLADFIFNYRTRRAFAWKPAVAALAMIVAMLGYGAIRLQQFESAMKSAPPEQWLTIGAVQPNIPIPVAQERQPAPHAVGNNFFTAMEQARQLARQHPEIDLLALPENPATFVFNQDSARRDALGALIEETGKPILLNVDAIDTANAGEGGAQRYNVAVLMDAKRNLAGYYPKMKRIPFVEYIPGETMFPWLRKGFPKSLRVLEGDGPKVFEMRSDIRIIPLICYEGTISSLTKQFVRLGGNVIVNQVNDSWFLRTPASEVHLALTLFRAVEFRVPLVRVTNAGIGAHIQADGRVVPGSRTELFATTATAFSLYIPPQRTIYAKIGNYWMFGLGLLLVRTFLRTSRILRIDRRKVPTL